MKIAVIIPAHNEAEYLPDILGSVEAQTRTPEYVVVVSDSSSDNTAQVAESVMGSWRNNAHTNVISVACRSIAGARNAGMNTVPDAEAFLCVDSDSILSSNVIAEMEAALNRGYDYGSFRLVLDSRFHTKRDILAQLLARIWLFGVHFSNRILGNFVGTGVFFLRTANTGYDESWGWAEDIELCERMRRDGKRWIYVPSATLAYCDRRFIERGYLREILQRMSRGVGHYRKPRKQDIQQRPV